MADTKISALTALTGANLAADDDFPVVDTSATATKRISVTELLTGTLGSTSKTGATETTSKPLLNMTQTWNAGAVTFTGWKLNVTNTASAAASMLMDLQLGGVSQFSVSRIGALTAITSVTSSSGSFSSFVVTPSVLVSTSTGTVAFGGASDVILGRRAAANLRLGAADAAAPVAQTLSVQSVVTGTSNTAGQPLVVALSQSTGTGLGGTFTVQGSPAGSTGTAVNSLVDLFTVDPAGSARVVRALTVATLPATPLTGMIARVTDATAPAGGTTVAGGGAAAALVWYNGANWTVLGV